MQLLLLNFGAYTWEDIRYTLCKRNLKFKELQYCFGDKNEDEFFTEYFERFLQEGRYTAVFTVNFFPLVAKCCYQKGIKYISWSYDNPLNVERIEETLGFETNYVFLFDRIQAEGYQKKGFGNVFHMPLAVNPDRLSKVSVSREEAKQFGADISFVGKLYQSPFPELIYPLSEYDRGFLTAAVDAQMKVYGGYFLDELLTKETMERINRQYANQSAGFSITKEQMAYAMASYTTRMERLMILGLLSKHYPLKLYSREQNELLKNVQYMGSAAYMRQMPKVFAASRLNLNITLKISRTGIPLRALDILGCGGALFSNYQEELAEAFIPGEDFILYESIEDTLDKAAFYLEHEDIRRQIAENGRRKAFEQFSYEDQFEKIFRIAGI